MQVGQATGVPFAKLGCRRMAMQVHGIQQKVNMLKVKQGMCMQRRVLKDLGKWKTGIDGRATEER